MKSGRKLNHVGVTPSKNNSSGYLGVSLEVRTTQKSECLYWCANWYVDGKKKRKGFSHLKWGAGKAKQLAILYRKRIVNDRRTTLTKGRKIA